jgi:8-oxo-dGTP diphosphatase
MSDFKRGQMVSGALCYLRQADLVLMLCRNRPSNQGLWTVPGGKIELGESPDECVYREMTEETGLKIIAPRLRAVVTVYDRDWPIHWVLFIYRADQSTGNLIACEEGELRWIPIRDLADYARPHADQQYSPHVLGDAPGVWRGKFVYHTPDQLVAETIYGVE